MATLPFNIPSFCSPAAITSNLNDRCKTQRFLRVPDHLSRSRATKIRAIETVPENESDAAATTSEEEPPSIDFAFVSSRLLPDGFPDIQLRSAVGGQKLRNIMLDSNIDLYGPYARFLLNCGGGGTCATCLVEVVKGKELLSPRTDKEMEALKKKPKTWRLACQTMVGKSDSRGQEALLIKMEDENLELSSGLPCGVHLVVNLMSKSPSDPKAVEEIGRKSPVGDLNFHSNHQLLCMAGSYQVHGKVPVDSVFMMGSQTQHVPAYGRRSCGDGITNQEQCEDEPNVSHAVIQVPRNPSLYIVKASNLLIGSARHVEEAGMSSSDETKGNNTTFRPKEIPDDHPVAEGSSHIGITIRPGVPLDLKFGGCGSYPDLPCVSTTSPDGKTISGVTYKYSKDEVKIVWACHGTHLSTD